MRHSKPVQFSSTTSGLSKTGLTLRWLAIAYTTMYKSIYIESQHQICNNNANYSMQPTVRQCQILTIESEFFFRNSIALEIHLMITFKQIVFRESSLAMLVICNHFATLRSAIWALKGVAKTPLVEINPRNH